MSLPLPFRQVAQLQKQGGGVLMDKLAVSVWKLPRGQTTSSGETYDWEGQAHPSAAVHLVNKPNRVLIVDGRRLRIEDFTEHEFLPHVQLLLSEMRPAG